MRTIALRLGPGADLKAELLALAAREGVRADWVLTCVGACPLLGCASLATPSTPPGRACSRSSPSPAPCRRTAATCTWRLHLAVADHQGRTRGGTSPRAAPCAPLVALAADDRLVFAASTILPPATTSWWSASVTPEARDRHRGPGSPGPFDPGKITAPKPLGGHRTAGRRWARLRRSPAGPGCAAPPPELPGAGPPPAPAALTRIPVPSSRSPGGMVQPGPAGNLVLVGAGGIAFGHRRPAIPRPADNQSPAWLAASPVAVSTSGWRGIGIGRRPRGCRGSCGVL
jgi:hypothetical protein